MVKKPPSKKAFGVFYPFSLLNTFNAPWKLDYLARKFYDSSYTINQKNSNYWNTIPIGQNHDIFLLLS